MLIATLKNTVNTNQQNDSSAKTNQSKNPFAAKHKISNYATFDFNQIPLQAKLKINTPNDRYEQEADRIAERIVNMRDSSGIEECRNPQIQKKSLLPEITIIDGNAAQRKCSKCEEEEEEEEEEEKLLQRKSLSLVPTVVSPHFNAQMNATKGKGDFLDASTNQYMSLRFGVDFSNVNIHTDSKAAKMSQSINAKAFTLGNDIYFNKGAYQPQTHEGKRLLAHELVHTVQQSGSIQREKFGKHIVFDQLPSCPPQVEVDGFYTEEEIADELYGDLSVKVDFQNNNLLNVNVSLLRQEWQPYFVNCVSDMAETTAPQKEIPVEQMVCNADVEYIGELEISAAKVAAKKGIRLHTTPDTADCDYVGRIGVSEKVYPKGTEITVIASSNKANENWVKIQTLDDFEGWIEDRFIKRVKKDSTKDVITKTFYEIESGDTLEEVINAEYKGYSYTTGNDRRTIAHALFVLNDGETDAFYFKGNGSSWWKDLLDSDFEETRNIYATIRLKKGKLLRLPSKAYIDLLRDEGKIGVRADWKNAAIEAGRSIEGFIEGVFYGFGKAIVDTLVGLWDLIKGIVTGELFEQVYEFYKQIKENGLKVIWNLVKDFFIGVYNDFKDAWNNPNPYKKWFFFGEIIGMILFEVAIAYLTAGIGNTRHIAKVGKVLEKVPGLKKIASKMGTKIDDIPAKEAKAISNVSKAEAKIDDLGDISGETRKMLRNPKNEKLLDSLNDNPKAARALKNCNSPCFPEFANPDQIKDIDDILRKIDTHLDNADYEGLKTFFHEAKTAEELGEKIDVIRSGLNKFIDDKSRGISPYEIDRLRKTEKIRSSAGWVKGGDNLPTVNASNVASWYDKRIMQIPKQIADKLKTKFKDGVPNFRKFRVELWKEMYNDPAINDFLSKRGAKVSLKEMKNGRPPFALSGQRTGRRANAKLQLNHQLALEHAGDVFDFDNLEIVSPVFHKAIEQ